MTTAVSMPGPFEMILLAGFGLMVLAGVVVAVVFATRSGKASRRGFDVSPPEQKSGRD